jgi:FKBP-type peptidyl-prolyl cis-trans isomerase
VFGVGLTTPHSKKLIVTKVKQRKMLDGFNDDGELVTGKKWKDLVRQAKAHSGLQCQWKKKKKEEEEEEEKKKKKKKKKKLRIIPNSLLIYHELHIISFYTYSVT